MKISNTFQTTRSAAKARSRTGHWIIAVALAAVLPTFSVSDAQAQVIFNETFDAPDTSKDPATTADWDTAASALHLPTIGTVPPVESLINSFLPSAISSAVDAGDTAVTRATAVGDLNGDGYDDIAFGNSGVNSVYFNNQFGAFIRGGNIPDDGNNTRSVAIADFNGDGHLDLIFAEFGTGQATRVHFNNGSGTQDVFTAGQFADLGDPSLKGDSVATGDIDNDGDIDVVLGIDGGYVKFFRNDGFGNFADAEEIVDSAPAFGFHARSILLGDLDNDGDLDVVAGREADSSRVYLNTGSGVFGAAQAVGGGVISNSLPAPDSAALGDVNGDGFLDLIIGSDGSGLDSLPSEPNRLFLNSGVASDVFPSATFEFSDLANTNGAQLVDVDLDGDLDIVTADFVQGNGTGVPGPNRLYINDPAANTPNIFPANGTSITADSAVSKSVASGDFDRDGDLDLVFGNDAGTTSTAQNSVVLNVGTSSGTPSEQLVATGLSLQVGAGFDLSLGVVLEPSTSNTVANKVFEYWLSDDGGLTWIVAHPNRSVAFPTPVGNDLRWRVELNSPSPALSPNLDYLRLRTDIAPSFSSAAVTAATQDQPYIYDIIVDDPNSGDLLDIRAVGVLPDWLTLTDNGDRTATLAGTPLSSNVGTLGNEVTLEVVDGAGQSATQVVAIDVADVNDPPTVIVPTGNQVYDQDEMVSLDTSLAFDDVDGDILTYSAAGLPASLLIDTMTGIVSGTLTNDDALASPHSVVITADDGNTGTVDDSFTITVNNINDAPTIIAPTVDQTIDEGTAVNLDTSLAFEDIDGDTLSYSATGLPASLTIDANTGVVTGTLTNDDVLAGPDFLIEVTATEVGTVELFSVAGSFTLTVSNVNDAPTVVAPTGNLAFAQGDTVNVNTSLAFDDVDGDTLTYSASGLPASLTLDGNTGVLSGTLTNDDAIGGPYSISITANDGNGGTVDDNFSMTVSNSNDAPTFTSTPLTAATEGSLYSYSVTAQDIDGDAIVISGTVPGWLTLSDNGDGTALLVGTPTSSDIGDVNVTLTVNDGTTPVDQPFTITVVAAADAPVITILGDNPQTVEQGATFVDDGATATDLQDGPLTVNATSNVDTSVVGTYSVIYSATDSANNNAQIQRVVNVVDTAAPVITLVGGPVTLTVGGSYTDQGATADDGLNGDITADIVTVNPVDTRTAGTYTVTYNVSDASGNAATEVTRTVTVNDPAPPTPTPRPSSGGGGATSLPALLLLAGVALGRRRRMKLGD